MKIFNKVVLSETEPDIHDLWIKEDPDSKGGGSKKSLYFYSDKGWEKFFDLDTKYKIAWNLKENSTGNFYPIYSTEDYYNPSTGVTTLNNIVSICTDYHYGGSRDLVTKEFVENYTDMRLSNYTEMYIHNNYYKMNIGAFGGYNEYGDLYVTSASDEGREMISEALGTVSAEELMNAIESGATLIDAGGNSIIVRSKTDSEIQLWAQQICDDAYIYSYEITVYLDYNNKPSITSVDVAVYEYMVLSESKYMDLVDLIPIVKTLKEDVLSLKQKVSSLQQEVASLKSQS